MHTHIVFFWLAEPDNQDHREALKAGVHQLMQDPMVRQSTVGKPAQTSRDVVESGYDIGLIAEFDSLAAHDTYQNGAHHQKFLEDCKTLWSRVQVYDVEI